MITFIINTPVLRCKTYLYEVGMKIKLVRSKDAFCLMGAAGMKLVMTHAWLFVRKVKLSPSVFLGHAKALENSTAKYPIKRVVCKTFAIPQNYLDVNHENCFRVNFRRV